MRLSAATGLLADLWLAICAAFVPTLHFLWRSPRALLDPTEVSRYFMSHVWAAGFGNGIDQNAREEKIKVITPYAHGVVLDLGAGHGHTVNYLDHAKVTKYVALEPNVHMHQKIRDIANATGYDEPSGTLLILAYGAEDIHAITRALGGRHTVDTVVSVLTLCSIPKPQAAIAALAQEALKPGGEFVFYEHVLSPRSDVAWWQRFWTPLWKLAFDGCRLDRSTCLWVDEVGGWSDKEVWGKAEEPEEHLFWHRSGRFVKAA